MATDDRGYYADAASKIATALGMLLFILVCIALFGVFTAAFISERVDTQSYSTIAFGFGILGALAAKKAGRSGILGFIVGFIALGALSAFFIGFVRAWMGQ